MIKRKVKPRKRKNPYREDKIDDGINLEKIKIFYEKGYLLGLLRGLRKFHSFSSRDYYDPNFYFWQGYKKGFNDSKEQLKLIPKNKLKQYIKELEEEIDTFCD